MNVKAQLNAIDSRVTSNANNIEQLKKADIERSSQLNAILTQLEEFRSDLMAQTNAILGKLKK
jgi:hypothetical protein